MQNTSLRDQLQHINALLSVPIANPAVQEHWGRYTCIVVAGFVENALQAIYSDYVAKSASPSVADYAIGQLKRITNPNSGSFIGTARSFNQDWGNELRDFIRFNDRNDALDALMSNRNKIAHGGESSISVDDVKQYLPKCVEVIDFIENQCLAAPQFTQ